MFNMSGKFMIWSSIYIFYLYVIKIDLTHVPCGRDVSLCFSDLSILLSGANILVSS